MSRILIIVALSLAAAACGREQAAPASGAHAATGEAPVRIVVDDGSGAAAPLDIAAPWRPGLTALEAMEASAETGELAFEYSGDGALAFIYEINGVANEGAGGRNWILRVNGQCARMGAGLLATAPGDAVQWVFVGRDKACD